MANRGYNGQNGDMDETRIYRDGFLPDTQDDGGQYGPYGDGGGYGDGYQNDGGYAQDGYDDGGYYEDDAYDGGYYDDGAYGNGAYDGEPYDSGYGYNGRVSMAARAAGKSNTEPYGRPRRSAPRQARQRAA